MSRIVVSRVEASKRLNTIMSEREVQIEKNLTWIIDVGKNLRLLLKEIPYELYGFREQLDILERAGEDVSKERKRLFNIVSDFGEFYIELTLVLESVQQGKISNLDCLPSIVHSFETLGKLHELIQDVDRRSRNAIKNFD